MNAVKKFIVAMLVVLGLGIVFFIGYFVKSNANQIGRASCRERV